MFLYGGMVCRPCRCQEKENGGLPFSFNLGIYTLQYISGVRRSLGVSGMGLAIPLGYETSSVGSHMVLLRGLSAYTVS
jgi:hypothetical protein